MWENAEGESFQEWGEEKGRIKENDGEGFVMSQCTPYNNNVIRRKKAKG
jgi:hypothetical protein